jgi:hypothetical protein
MKINLDKKSFEKDWGKRCKDYSPLCAICSVWHAWDILMDLYSLKVDKHWGNKGIK